MVFRKVKKERYGLLAIDKEELRVYKSRLSFGWGISKKFQTNYLDILIDFDEGLLAIKETTDSRSGYKFNKDSKYKSKQIICKKVTASIENGVYHLLKEEEGMWIFEIVLTEYGKKNLRDYLEIKEKEENEKNTTK